MLLHRKNIEELLYEISYWIRELKFDLKSYVEKNCGFSGKSVKEVICFRNDEILILFRALPAEVSIPVLSIMNLYFTSSELRRYYKDNLVSKEKDVLIYFFHNYYVKNIKKEVFSESVPPQKINHITLDMGVGLKWLVPVINKHIEDLRKTIFEQKGVIIPEVSVSVLSDLHPQQYIIGPGNNRGRLMGNKVLATGSDEYIRLLEGDHSFEPVYGTASIWIDMEEGNKIAARGSLILKAEDLLITHISSVIEKHISLFVDEDYVSSCLQEINKSHPLLIKRLKEINIPGKAIVSILRNLISEGVNIRDTVSILSEMLQLWPRTDDSEVITEYIIKHFSPLSCYNYIAGKKLHCFTIPSHIEEELKKLSLWDNLFEEKLPEEMRRFLLSYIENVTVLMEINKEKPVLVTGSDIRLYIKKLISDKIPSVKILSREDIDSEIELVEENFPVKDIKYVCPHILNNEEFKNNACRIIWDIKDTFSADEYLFVLLPFDCTSIFRHMTERFPWIKVLSIEGLRDMPEIKDRITGKRCDMFLNIFSMILKEDIEKAEKEISVLKNMYSSPWISIMEGIVLKHKNNYHGFQQKIMDGLREKPYLLNIFPLRELNITEYDLKEKELFAKYYDEKFTGFSHELSCTSYGSICFKDTVSPQMEIVMSKELMDKIKNDELKKYLYDLKIEFMAKKGLILPDIVFTEHNSLKDYSIFFKGFAVKKNKPFISIQKLINDIKEIIYKKSYFFIDINQTDDILGRGRVKCPWCVEKLDSLRIPADSMWKIFQYLLKKGGNLLNIEPVLEITGKLWQKNRDTAFIAEKALEKLIYIDEQNMALGKLYFIWQNKLKEPVLKGALSQVDYSVLAGIIKDFDFSSFLSKRHSFLDTAFSDLRFFNKKAWLTALDFADINEITEAFKEAPDELYDHVISLLPDDTVSFFKDVTSQPLIKKSVTDDGRVILFNIFKSLVILGKCHFPDGLLSSPAWLAPDRLHLTYEKEKFIKSLTDREKIAIIIHNLPEPVSVFLQILFPDYNPPEYHYEISWEILKEFYEKYFKFMSPSVDLSFYVKSFDRIILKAGEKICRGDYAGAIDILKIEPENRIAGFLISILLKYTGKSFSSDEYAAQSIDYSRMLLQYGWHDKKMSALELGYYLSHTDFYRKYGENYLAACGYRLKGEKNPNSLVFYEQGECYFDAEMYGHAFISYGKSLEWLKREHRYKLSDFTKNLLRKLFDTLYLSRTVEDIASAVFSLPEEKIFPCLKMFSSEENLNKLLAFKGKSGKEASHVREILFLCTEDLFHGISQ